MGLSPQYWPFSLEMRAVVHRAHATVNVTVVRKIDLVLANHSLNKRLSRVVNFLCVFLKIYL